MKIVVLTFNPREAKESRIRETREEIKGKDKEWKEKRMTKLKSQMLLEEAMHKKVESERLKKEYLELQKKGLEQLLIDYELTGDILYMDIYNNKSEWEPGKIMIGKELGAFRVFIYLYTKNGKLRKRPSHTYYTYESFLLDYNGKYIKRM